MNSEKAAQELSFIKKVIEENRRVSYPNGIYYVIWGIVVYLGMLGNFFLIKSGKSEYLLWMWVALAAGGWVYTMIESRREERKAEFTNWSATVYSYIWLAAGISMTIIGFSVPFSKLIHPMAICPLIGIVLGFAHFISGTINDFKWQQWVGVLWWLGSLFLLFWISIYNFLVYAVMVVFLQTLPGFILNKYYKGK